MARSLERIFEFWKQEKVTRSLIWRIQWLSNYFCFVFSQKFSHNQAGMWRCFIFRYESGGDALHTHNMNNNVLSRSIRDVESLCYLSNANTAIFETIFFTFSMLSLLTKVDGPLAWGKFSTTLRSSLNVDSTKHFCNILNDSLAVIPLETQNFKQTHCSIFFP